MSKHVILDFHLSLNFEGQSEQKDSRLLRRLPRFDEIETQAGLADP